VWVVVNDAAEEAVPVRWDEAGGEERAALVGTCCGFFSISRTSLKYGLRKLWRAVYLQKKEGANRGAGCEEARGEKGRNRSSGS
jgi:hypothetical protein